MANPDNAILTEHAEGLWGWATRHPEWHPGDFGAEVVSFAARGRGGVLLLLDPLLPDRAEREAVLALLDRQAALKSTKAISIQISVGYHARSTEELWDRYRNGDVPISVHGHDAVRKRLGKRVDKDFAEIEAGVELPGGVVPYAIGKPRRQETPLWIPSHSAILFGDAVVGAEGGARAWPDGPVDAKTDAFYRERFNPTLEPLLELGAERLLFTHGPSVLSNGAEVLREGLAAGPWHHRN
jgi:hypothetical protein